MAELTILIPVLKRPHRVKPTVESIRKATPNAWMLFICDPDDTEEQETIDRAKEDYVCVDGNYARKINAGVELTDDYPLLFFGADDLDFKPGWFEAAKAKLTKGIGVVGTNDLCNPLNAKGKLATHPLVTREYTKLGTIDDSSKVLHESYKHEYVDREFTETAIFRGAYAHAPESIVEHLHPQVGKAPMDELYAQQWNRMWAGRRIYTRRRRKWTSA